MTSDEPREQREPVEDERDPNLRVRGPGDREAGGDARRRAAWAGRRQSVSVGEVALRLSRKTFPGKTRERSRRTSSQGIRWETTVRSAASRARRAA